ncbi:MAG: hypothetical protein ACYS67_13905 [Planctomycetota bacterium]
MIGKNRLTVFAYYCFASQDVVVVLGKAVGFIPDVLQQLADRGRSVRGDRFRVCGRF